MKTHACPHVVTVGSYLLGMLGAQESSEFRRHADLCSHCTREIDELAPGAHFLEALKVVTLATERSLCLSGTVAVQGLRCGPGSCWTLAPR